MSISYVFSPKICITNGLYVCLGYVARVFPNYVIYLECLSHIGIHLGRLLMVTQSLSGHGFTAHRVTATHRPSTCSVFTCQWGGWLSSDWRVSEVLPCGQPIV